MSIYNVQFVMRYSVVSTVVDVEAANIPQQAGNPLERDSEKIVSLATKVIFENDGFDVSKAQDVEIEAQ